MSDEEALNLAKGVDDFREWKIEEETDKYARTFRGICNVAGHQVSEN